MIAFGPIIAGTSLVTRQPGEGVVTMKARHLLALAIALSLVACGGEKKAGGASGGDKNTLVIAWQSSPTNLDIRVGNDNASGRMFDLIYSGLVKVTPDMN